MDFSYLYVPLLILKKNPQIKKKILFGYQVFTAPHLVISVDHWADRSERCINWFWNLESWNAVFLYWTLTQWHVTLSVIPMYFNTGQKWDTAALPASLLFILCFPHLCLCSSSFLYSSFSNPSAPGSVLHFYFVCSWTEMNKGKSNIKLAVCSRIYTFQVWQWNVWVECVTCLFCVVCGHYTKHLNLPVQYCV